jgi:hypothetical protein
VGSSEEKRGHSQGAERTGEQDSDQDTRRRSLPGTLAGAAGATAAGAAAGALARDQLRDARQSDPSDDDADPAMSGQPVEADEPADIAALDVFEQRLPTSSVPSSETATTNQAIGSPPIPGAPASAATAAGMSPTGEVTAPQRPPASTAAPQPAPAAPASPSASISSPTPTSMPSTAAPGPAPNPVQQPPPAAGIVPPAEPNLAAGISTPIIAPQFPTPGAAPDPDAGTVSDAQPVASTGENDPVAVTDPNAGPANPDPVAGYVDAPVDAGGDETSPDAAGDSPPTTDLPTMPPGYDAETPDVDANEPPAMPPAHDATPSPGDAAEAPPQHDAPGTPPPIGVPVDPPHQAPGDDPVDQAPPPLDDPVDGGQTRYFYSQNYLHPEDVYGTAENSFVRSIDNANVDVYANETIYVVTRSDGSQVIAWLATDSQGRPILNQTGNDVPDLLVNVAPNGSYEIQTYPISHVSGIVVSLDLGDYPDRVDPDSLDLPHTESFDSQANLRREYSDGTVKTFFRSWDNVGAVSIKYPDDILVYVEANGNAIAQDTSGAPVLIDRPPEVLDGTDDDLVEQENDLVGGDESSAPGARPFEIPRPDDLLNIDPSNLTRGGRFGQPPANAENAGVENAPAGPFPAGPLPSLPSDSPITDRGNLPTLPTLSGESETDQSAPDPAAVPRPSFEPLQPPDLQNIDPGNLTPFGTGFGRSAVDDVSRPDTTPPEDEDDLEP